MPLFKLAIIIICVVIVLVPVAIYIVAKYSDLDSYRKRFRKANPDLFWRDKTDKQS